MVEVYCFPGQVPKSIWDLKAKNKEHKVGWVGSWGWTWEKKQDGEWIWSKYIIGSTQTINKKDI